MPNLKLALRGLIRTPVFTATAVLSLAFGIGANTSIFSILDQILLRTLPIRNPQEIVLLYHPGPLQGSGSSDEDGGPSFSYPLFRELRKLQAPFVDIAASRRATASISYNNQPLSGNAQIVSGNYFELLGVQPAFGRLFTSADDTTPGGNPVAVLSHSFWLNQFGANPAMLNQTILVNSVPLTVVGVSAKGFFSENPGNVPHVFVPVTMKADLTPGWKGFDNRKDHWLSLFARLKPGISLGQAGSAINTIYRGQLEIEEKLLSNPSQTLLARFRAKSIDVLKGAIMAVAACGKRAASRC